MTEEQVLPLMSRTSWVIHSMASWCLQNKSSWRVTPLNVSTADEAISPKRVGTSVHISWAAGQDVAQASGSGGNVSGAKLKLAKPLLSTPAGPSMNSMLCSRRSCKFLGSAWANSAAAMENSSRNAFMALSLLTPLMGDLGPSLSQNNKDIHVEVWYLEYKNSVRSNDFGVGPNQKRLKKTHCDT